MTIKWNVRKNYDGSLYSESDCGRYRILNKGMENGNKYCLTGKIGKDGRDYGVFYITYLFEGTRTEIKKMVDKINRE